MRRFKAVDKVRQKNLEVKFPRIVDLVVADPMPEQYEYLTISIFDHWLSSEEADDLLSEVGADEQSRRNASFNRFNEIMIKNTEVLLVSLCGIRGSKVRFKEFTFIDAKRAYLAQSGRQVYTVALPALGAVYFEGFDDTNHFFLNEPDSKGQIEDWAEQAGLYVLQ